MAGMSVEKKACPNFGQMLLGHRPRREFTSSMSRGKILRSFILSLPDGKCVRLRSWLASDRFCRLSPYLRTAGCCYTRGGSRGRAISCLWKGFIDGGGWQSSESYRQGRAQVSISREGEVLDRKSAVTPLPRGLPPNGPHSDQSENPRQNNRQRDCD